jgi:flagellar hook-basal body complex protein FliE
MIPFLSAVGSAATQLQAAAPSSAIASTSGPSFEDMLKQAATDAVDTMQQGEAAAIEGVKGSMSTFKVVDAVMSAQRTLQQTLSIRDKAVTAYQDITRMSI